MRLPFSIGVDFSRQLSYPRLILGATTRGVASVPRFSNDGIQRAGQLRLGKMLITPPEFA
jgi:hypothetical protein